jgi:hypothetical protein
MKTLSATQYIVQGQTQFLLRNPVLGPPDFNMDNFLPRNTVLVSFSGIEQFGTKVMFLTL